MTPMIAFLLVWLVSSLTVVVALYLAKSVRWRGFARLGSFHWPGLIVISLIIGALPAFIYDYQSSRAVPVPDGVAERPDLPGPANK